MQQPKLIFPPNYNKQKTLKKQSGKHTVSFGGNRILYQFELNLQLTK